MQEELPISLKFLQSHNINTVVSFLDFGQIALIIINLHVRLTIISTELTWGLRKNSGYPNPRLILMY
ncbi:hypothetical protein TI05_10145 [Achromatium sp. WMS3]|nr:hypothetical protein TI05_10145 [Achromatium sp. WMS3]